MYVRMQDSIKNFPVIISPFVYVPTGRGEMNLPGRVSARNPSHRPLPTRTLYVRQRSEFMTHYCGVRNVLIPMKAVSDSDLIPVTRSDAMPVKIGAQRRWRPYRA